MRTTARVMFTRVGCVVVLATMASCNRYCSVTPRPRLPTPDSYHPLITEVNAVDVWSGSRDHRRWGPNEFELDLEETRELDEYAAEQERADYCWAASVQMVYAMTGIRGLRQDDIVRAIHGGKNPDADRSATQGDVVRALNGYRPSARGAVAYIQATEFAAWSNGFVEDLAQGWPIVLGIRDSDQATGHVVVLTRLRYSYGPMGEAIIHDATVWDPWPDEGWRELEGYELRDVIRFAIRVRVIHG